MSDSEEELPNIDEDDYYNYNGHNHYLQNQNNGDEEKDESDIEVIWEGNNSHNEGLNKKPSSSKEYSPSLPNSGCSSSISSSITSTSTTTTTTGKYKHKNLISVDVDSEEEESVRVMLPKKKRKPVKSSSSSSVDKDNDKEKKRLEKENQREIKRLEKEKKKEEEQRAKELRKVTSEVQKSVKPGESIKYMTVILDSLITQKYDALIPLLVVADLKYEVETDPIIENSIFLKREVIQKAMGDDQKIKLVSKFLDEDQVIIILDSDKVVTMAHAQLKKQSGNNNDHDENDLDLTTWVESIVSVLSGKKLTLFLFDMDKYFRKIKKNTQQDFRNRVLQAGSTAPVQNKRRQKQTNLPDLSQTELYGSLIEMQLQTGVNYRMIKNVNELSSTLIQYTKAIADAPFKKQRLESQGFDWFALGDSTGSVKVEKDGSGLKQLWVEQLQQFNNVGPDMALAISNRYPSPKELFRAYKSCNNQDEGESMLKDLSVVTGVGPLARTRKIGLETSKKLYRFFSSTNGDRFLGSTQDSR